VGFKKQRVSSALGIPAKPAGDLQAYRPVVNIEKFVAVFAV
jgi:hypothetical protein